MNLLPTSRILIIGGGVSGIVTLRNLSLHGNFDCIQLIERRPKIGGVWFLEEQSPTSPPPKWQSPAYPELIGNALPEFMSFSSYPKFPHPPSAPDQPFPSLEETHAYLSTFAQPFLDDGQIRCGIEMIRLEETTNGRWEALVQDVQTGKESQELWDAVVVCTGWHSTPWWPPTPGISELKEKNLAIHAKDWMGVDFHGLQGKKVLVLGNAASGNDISAQLANKAPGPGYVFRSIRRPAFPGFPSLPSLKIKDVPVVEQYSAPNKDNGKFSAYLSDGTSIDELDMGIAGTGYRSEQDFIYIRSAASQQFKDPQCLMTTIERGERRIPSLHEHIIYAPNPSLAFIGCIMAFTPFTIADLCSAWLALAWTGYVEYPDTVEERLEWEKERLKSTAEVRKEFSQDGEATNYISYNVLGFGEQSYAERLKKEIELGGEKGKAVSSTLPEWNDLRTKERERMYVMKLEALKLGEFSHK